MNKKNINPEELKDIIDSYVNAIPFHFSLGKKINFDLAYDLDYEYSLNEIKYSGNPLVLPRRWDMSDRNFIIEEESFRKPKVYLLSRVLEKQRPDEYQRNEVTQSLVLYGGKKKQLEEKIQKKIRNLEESKDSLMGAYGPDNHWVLSAKHHSNSMLFLSSNNLGPNNSMMKDIAMKFFTYKARCLDTTDITKELTHFVEYDYSVADWTDASPYSSMTLKSENLRL